MKCKNCRKSVTHTINCLCVSCYVDENLPTKVNDTSWIVAFCSDGRGKEAKGKTNSNIDESLATAIVDGKITIEKDKKTILIQTENDVLSIPITIENIDSLAQKSGILIGKWLIYRTESEIDSAWKAIAENTWSGKLTSCAKVSTSAQKSKRHVICVYTDNYLDYEDVERIREKLRNLGFGEELCYKPDVYTYLGIYYRKSSLSPCRYRM